MVKRHNRAILIAKKYIDHLRKNNIKVEKAYLYGSYANGRAHKDSDIDIVVVSSEFKGSRYDESVRLAKLRRPINLHISPLAYNPKDFTKQNLIPYEAMTNGIRIA
ncbi:MAG: nucleotidyltransferase domain-containing protein [Bacteroidetes bacterium]|nr:nucleotidyltransferase domain-containing protein [Bacteroidota bacterium]MBU1422745.1 nucleotidyltransferase domain-containing protein [Bacteroidota bacterium]MBU2471871.1 nucleotidyltransferase domain-containing protein [Bacteroidota bacterium]MBU2636217.1 nucleotidyltransferase domain-containing protein [Bacteroidota bacterium]